MLRTRILSAIVMLPLTLGVLALGGGWFLVAIGLILSVAAWELMSLLQRAGYTPWLPPMVALIWILLADRAFGLASWLSPSIAAVLLLSLAWAMAQFNRQIPQATASWALAVAGGLYLGWLGANFVGLRQLEDGLYWSLTVYGCTWLADSGAYFVGRAWGRHKLAPKLSPGKTWEGSLGGFIVGTLAGLGLALVLGLPPRHGLALGVLVSALSPIGDLGISLIKREVGAKDSSNLIPGHGGLLDKIDSLIVGVTLAAAYINWVVR